MPREFVGRHVGGLRNTEGRGVVVRLMDYRLIHDLRWDELAVAKGAAWDERIPYLVVRYPAARESVDAAGRIALAPPFAGYGVTAFADFGAAQEEYIASCQAQAGKTRRQWRPGQTVEAEDE